MIHLENVSKLFIVGKENIHALSNISLHVKRGECVVLKGASGSGKSTILSLVAGLSKPSSGNVLVDGNSIAKLMDNFSAQFRQHSIGFIFQKYNLIPNLSVQENILLPLIPQNLPSQVLETKAQVLMEQFGLMSKARIATKHLSGGEQQRVAIARALANTPKIIIADEPTANLDATLSEAFIAHVETLKNLGTTILLATHDPLFFGLDFVDRIVEIKGGKIVP